jgi:hypothetical protein
MRFALFMVTPGGKDPSNNVITFGPIAKAFTDLFMGIPTYAVNGSAVISGDAGGAISKVIATVELWAPSVTVSDTG